MNSDIPFWIVNRDSNRFRSFTWNHSSFPDWINYLEIMKSGDQFGGKWNPPFLSLYYDEEVKGGGEKLPIGDFMNGIVDLSMNSRARSILEPILQNQVELLPLKTSIGVYFELNIRHISCLDISRCTVERFKSSGRIMHAKTYAFFEENISGINLFCSSELSINPLFASDLFKKTVESNNLTGLEFERIPVE